MAVPKQNALLVGTYCSLNKGDRLMQEVVLEALEASGSFDSLTIATPFPDLDAGCYPQARKVKARRRNLPLSLATVLLLTLLPRRGRLWLARFSQELTAYRQADLVIDLSGDMLTEDYGPLVGLSHAIPLWLAVLYDRPLYVIGQSIGPFRWLQGLYRYLLSHAECITARDAPSQQILQQLGLGNCSLTADLAFLARPRQPVEGPAFIQTGGEKLVGLCLSSLLLNKFAGPGYAGFLALVRALLTWSQTNGVKIVFISHVENRKPELADSQLYRRLQQDLNEELRIVGEALGPAEIKWIISQLTALISFRMHPCIAALDTGIPVIGVSYSHKTRGLFEQAGVGAWVMDSNRLHHQALIAKLEQLLNSRDEIRATLEQTIPVMRLAARANIDCLLPGGSW